MINREIHSSFSSPEKLNYKKKWNLLKNSHSSCKKRVWPSLAALHKMARVKRLWNPGAAKKWLWWSVYGKNFNSNNSGQFFASLLPQLHYRNQQKKSPKLILLKNFALDRPSQPFLGFHNFFTLAILCRAARLGTSGFIYSLNGCFWVDFTSFCDLTFKGRKWRWFMSVSLC